jgi:C_GCAxxG_C_C family probable redox protein
MKPCDTQSDYDSVRSYFCCTGFNCAESTMQLLKLKRKIIISPDMVKAMSGFGGGMQRGLVCGAVTASVAALGLLTGRKKPEEPREPSAKAVRTFLAEFERTFGALTCDKLIADLEPKSQEMYEHCAHFVIGSVKILTEMIADGGLKATLG